MCVQECVTVIATSFMLGSVPFGVIVSKAGGAPDPRTTGSGNTGATNILRSGRKDLAALTLLLDGGKGFAAVYLAYYLWLPHPFVGALAILLATVGHIYSPWLKFKGGKGVATTLGGVLALSWPVGFTLMALWLMIFTITRISSLSSLTALAFLPLMASIRIDASSALILSVAAGIVIYKHASNISRLLKGDEPRFTSDKK